MGQHDTEEMLYLGLILSISFSIGRTKMLSCEIRSSITEKKITLIKYHHTTYRPAKISPVDLKKNKKKQTLLWSHFIFNPGSRQTSPIVLSLMIIFQSLSHLEQSYHLTLLFTTLNLLKSLSPVIL